MYFHQSSFKFSDTATHYILDKYTDVFNNNFMHDLDINQYFGNNQNEWYHSLVGNELNTYLKQFNCDTSYYGITAFISNTTDIYLGNPHVDTRFDKQGNPSTIKSRLNVLVLGNPTDNMFWWDTMRYGDERMIDSSYKDLNGVEYISKSVPGNTMRERWNYLSEPTMVANNILTPSAFVRTDCVHTVTCSAGPRLIVTVALNKSIEELADVTQRWCTSLVRKRS